MENAYTKTICNPRRVAALGIHEHDYFGEAKSGNARGQVNQNWMRARMPVHDVLRINHYWGKSREEVVAKRSRGRAACGDPGEVARLLDRVDSDIADRREDGPEDPVLDWAIPLVKQSLEARLRSSQVYGLPQQNSTS
jgi:hypothetical protein